MKINLFIFLLICTIVEIFAARHFLYRHRFKRQTQGGYSQDPETCKKYNDNLMKMWSTLSKYLNYTDSVNEIALHNIAVMVEAYLDHKAKKDHEHPIDVSRDERKKDKISQYLRKIKKILGTEDATDKVKDIILNNFKPEYEEDDSECKQINEDNLVSSIAISYKNYLDNAQCHGDYDTGLLRGKALLRTGPPTKTDIEFTNNYNELGNNRKSILNDEELSDDFEMPVAKRTKLRKSSHQRIRSKRSAYRDFNTRKESRSTKVRSNARRKLKTVARKKSKGRKRSHVRTDQSCVKYANRKFLITLRTSIERFMALRDCQHDDTLRTSNNQIESDEVENNDINKESKRTKLYVELEQVNSSPEPEMDNTNTTTVLEQETTATVPELETTSTEPVLENVTIVPKLEKNNTEIGPEQTSTETELENLVSEPKTVTKYTLLREDNNNAEIKNTTTVPEQETTTTVPELETTTTETVLENVTIVPELEKNNTDIEPEQISIDTKLENLVSERKTVTKYSLLREGNTNAEIEITTTVPEQETASTVPELETTTTEPVLKNVTIVPELEKNNTDIEPEQTSTETELENLVSEPKTVTKYTLLREDNNNAEIENTTTVPEQETTTTEPVLKNVTIVPELEKNNTDIEPEQTSTETELENLVSEPKTVTKYTLLREDNNNAEIENTTTVPEQETTTTVPELETTTTETVLENVTIVPELEKNNTDIEPEQISTDTKLENLVNEPRRVTTNSILRMQGPTQRSFNERHFYSDTELGSKEQSQINNYLSQVKEFEDQYPAAAKKPIYVVHSATYNKPFLIKLKNNQQMSGKQQSFNKYSVHTQNVQSSYGSSFKPQPNSNKNIDSVYKSFLDSSKIHAKNMLLSKLQDDIDTKQKLKDNSKINLFDLLKRQMNELNENGALMSSNNIPYEVFARQNEDINNNIFAGFNDSFVENGEFVIPNHDSSSDVTFGAIGDILNDVRNASLQTPQVDTLSLATENEKGYVELSYLVKYPKSIIYRPHYLVKNILQYEDFVKVANQIYLTDDDKQLLKIVRYLPNNISQTLFETQDFTTPLEIHDMNIKVHESKQLHIILPENISSTSELPDLLQNGTDENDNNSDITNPIETNDDAPSAARKGLRTEDDSSMELSISSSENIFKYKQESIDPKEHQRTSNISEQLVLNMTSYNFDDNDEPTMVILNDSLNSGDFFNSTEELKPLENNITSHNIDDIPFADYLRFRLDNAEANLSAASHAYLKELEAQGAAPSTLTKSMLRTWWESWKKKLNAKFRTNLRNSTTETFLNQIDQNSTVADTIVLPIESIETL